MTSPAHESSEPSDTNSLSLPSSSTCWCPLHNAVDPPPVSCSLARLEPLPTKQIPPTPLRSTKYSRSPTSVPRLINNGYGKPPSLNSQASTSDHVVGDTALQPSGRAITGDSFHSTPTPVVGSLTIASCSNTRSHGNVAMLLATRSTRVPRSSSSQRTAGRT